MPFSYYFDRIQKLRAENAQRLEKRRWLRAAGLDLSDGYNTWCIMQNLREMRRYYRTIRGIGFV